MMNKVPALVAALAMGAGLSVSAPAAAQTPAQVHAESGLPFCSATVKDRCIQRVDLVREGKSTAKK